MKTTKEIKVRKNELKEQVMYWVEVISKTESNDQFNYNAYKSTDAAYIINDMVADGIVSKRDMRIPTKSQLKSHLKSYIEAFIEANE